MSTYQEFITTYQSLPDQDKKIIDGAMHAIIIGHPHERITPESPASDAMLLFYSLDERKDRKDLARLIEWLGNGNDMPAGETLAEKIADIEKVREIRNRIYEDRDKRDIERGKSIPAAFLGALSDTASRAFRDWLESNNVPGEVLEMLDCIVLMERFESTLNAGGELGKWDYAELLNTIARTTRLTADFGGEFHGADSYYPGKEPIIVWERVGVGFPFHTEQVSV
jgi:hypothetical protein